ncbi:PREDICTED: B3 domain-containing protein Os01g0234100-like [Nicotiana attenuata]|uniref:B3 domain-containing protein n=1 Tax=Nicotiana attenuata TaxID=49451 RepID=A0A1J6IBL0_NICAT|nr:PREDICTED: B3 domain-containing protein Os01g0234100-like [Nicotiana attenuata]OIS96354.1 b3 domain-containing protein [Nicotiana attenuata]
MAISAMNSSKKSPLLSSSKKRALEIKEKLLRKRALGPSKTNKVKNGDTKKLQICPEKKTYKTSTVDANSSAMLRAEEVQANLPSQFPSFVKYMLHSHVSRGFWLSFPRKFCDSYLPKHDDTVVLVDENEEEFSTKYLIDKNGLSGGWRGFSIAHNLLEGDVLVFQLIQPCKFKVYIIRENNLTEIDGAISLLNLDLHARPIKSDIKQEEAVLIPDSDQGPASDQRENDSDNGSEVLSIRFSESRLEFKDVKDFSGFNILVDGLIIDAEIPAHIRTKYYDLCCTQNSFLHEHLLGGLNCKLAAGMITETVNIADAIKASKISIPRDYLETWDNTLKGFECLGMNVGFLRARLSKLISMSCESDNILVSKRVKLAEAKEEMRNLEEKVLKVKQVIKKLDSEIEALTVKDTSFELKFKALAAAPW